MKRTEDLRTVMEGTPADGGQRLSIEVIPGDGSDGPPDWLSDADQQAYRPFLYVEGHLGVPRKVLYKAYVVAVREFAKLRPSPRSASSPIDAERLAHLSAVILLANPAHQTALNTRKQLFSSGLLDTSKELQFLSALLVVRECSKESLLWHHRRWLLRRIVTTDVVANARCIRQEDTLRDTVLSTETLRSEFAIVAQACETYPRNYFAWIHRYLCLEALVMLARSPTPFQQAYRSLLLEEVLFARTWIERHISDYTAVHYFCNMHLLLLRQEDIPLPIDAARTLDLDHIDNLTLRTALYAHAKSLLASYPEHETMWLYLRAAIYICGTDVYAADPDGAHDRGLGAPAPSKLLVLTHAERHRAWLRRAST
ncbi:hypothetical protein EVJ58_g7038 [Rhodofomes roseus]|uniref:Protein prenylyltransferase n=1 Tax=Rhodofomes roseus TaxID=34475 RepID=A0A4Y9Y6I7_9APHY|nr:hypothetical protein EVJ58_g7038 [Rhodofomes roseus]